MKKFFAILLAAIMMLSMTAMAAKLNVSSTNIGGDTNTTEETYTAYKILTADSTGTVYTIKNNDPWFSVLYDEETKADKQDYLHLTPTANDTTEYTVTLKADNSEATAKALAAYLNTNKPTGVTGQTLIVGENDVADGYYLVTSTMGNALVLDTFQTADLRVKNSYPELTKEADVDNATIGTNVNFTLTLIVPATVDKLVTVHDVMENGFTVTEAGFSVKIADNADGIATATASAITPDTEKDHETCSYEFTFDAATVAGKTVVITYTAELDKDAEINGETAEGKDGINTNTAYVTYSTFTSTPSSDTVKTYTTTFTKKDGATEGEDAGKPLPGAEFKLYTSVDKAEGTEINVVKVEEGVYRVADTTEKKYDTITTPTNGVVIIKGLGNGTYYLFETKAPTGYNLMTTATTIKIENANTAADAITINNNKGSELPSTGGIGTTIFYVVGGLMMAAALVLLVSKRKVSASK